MKRWAVGFISTYDSELEIEIISADTWQSALSMHGQLSDMLPIGCNTLEQAKDNALDSGYVIDVVEIPEIEHK